MQHEPDEIERPVRLSREQSRRVDQLAVEKLGIPSIVLMENAAINAANALMDLLDIERQLKPYEARVSLFCGGGNNGGDGFAMARHLHNWGAEVTIYAIKPIDQLTGDARINADICRHMNLAITVLEDDSNLLQALGASHQAHAIVDALLGTGFQGELRSPVDRLLERLNELESPLRMAVDIPSGLDGDTGVAAEHSFVADLTVTFVAEKIGFQEATALPYLGRVVVADIGIPDTLTDQAMAG